MTIVEKRFGKHGVMIYIVRKSNLKVVNGAYINPRQIKNVIDHDADVYTDDGTLLLRFRKQVLPLKHIEEAYVNMIQFAHRTTRVRGAVSGSEVKDHAYNKLIASNIMGYFDVWTIYQKHMFKTLRMKPPAFDVRVTQFTSDYPEKWKMIVPLIQDVDKMYKKLAPSHYKVQRAKADETAFKVPGTSFSTVTTNLNLQTAIHKDVGNLKESFGNLIVIEHGKYEGGYTCYPEYGIGVDVRTGDFLAMNIHIYHGNTAIKKKTKDAERLSLVCYLREKLVEKSRGSTDKDVQESIATMRKVLSDYQMLRKNQHHVV